MELVEFIERLSATSVGDARNVVRLDKPAKRLRATGSAS